MIRCYDHSILFQTLIEDIYNDKELAKIENKDNIDEEYMCKYIEMLQDYKRRKNRIEI